MYHKIRITMISLVVMIVCVFSSSATLSYFTDSDVKTNDFAVGNASTSLAIYDDEAGGAEHILHAENYTLVDNSDVPFYLQATNDGNIPVYQRFRVVIPIALAGIVTLDLPPMDDDCVITTTSENTCSNTDYTVTYKPSVNVEGAPTYAEYYIISNDAIDVDHATSEWPTLNIHISGDQNTIMENSASTCTNNNNNNCILGINAYSDVIQTTGFTDAIDAFENFRETY